MTRPVEQLSPAAVEARQGAIHEIIIGRGGQLNGMERNHFAQNTASEVGMQSVAGVGKSNVTQI